MKDDAVYLRHIADSIDAVVDEELGRPAPP